MFGPVMDLCVSLSFLRYEVLSRDPYRNLLFKLKLHTSFLKSGSQGD